MYPCETWIDFTDGGLDREEEIIASCKFFGDSLSLCGGLLGEPQLVPLLVEFNHF